MKITIFSYLYFWFQIAVSNRRLNARLWYQHHMCNHKTASGLPPSFSCLTPPKSSPPLLQTPVVSLPSPPLLPPLTTSLPTSPSPLIQSVGCSLRATQTPVIQCPPSLMASSSSCKLRRSESNEIKRPVPLRITQEERWDFTFVSNVT